VIVSEHTHSITVDVDGTPVILPVGGSVTLDDGWAPYIQAEVTCAKPSADVLEALDPRGGARVVLTSSRGGGDEFTADLGVRSRVVADGVLTLTLASDEAIAQDVSVVFDWGGGPELTLADQVDRFLWHLGGAALVDHDYDVPREGDTWVFRLPGMNVWETLEPVVQQAGRRLYNDEERLWRLVPASRNDPTVQVWLGREAVITELEDSIDLDADLWADAVVIRYEWTDLAGERQQATDVAPANYDGNGLTRVRVLDYESPYPGPGAAQHVLNRAQAQGHQLVPEAVNQYQARPGARVIVVRPDGWMAGFISAVTFSFDDNRMRITPRELIPITEYPWAGIPAGESWADSAPGIPWTTP